jgi:hypothetical protein
MNYNKVKSFEQRYIKAMHEATKKVREQFQEEFKTLVKENLADDVYLCSGMGSTSFYKYDETGKDSEIENQVTEIINNLEWGLDREFCFNLSLPYKMTATKVLTKDVQIIIDKLYENQGGTFKAVRNNFVSPHLAHIRYFKGWEVDENIIKSAEKS